MKFKVIEVVGFCEEVLKNQLKKFVVEDKPKRVFCMSQSSSKIDDGVQTILTICYE